MGDTLIVPPRSTLGLAAKREGKGRRERRTSPSLQGNSEQGMKGKLERFQKLSHFPLFLILMPTLNSQAVSTLIWAGTTDRRKGYVYFETVRGKWISERLFFLADI